MRRELLASLFFGACGALAGGASLAQEPSVSPYIDSLREEMRQEHPVEEPARDASDPEPYIQSIKKQMRENGPGPAVPEQGYTEQLKKELGLEPKNEPSYSEQLKSSLPPTPEGGAIEAVNAGRSELHAKREGEIHNAAGIRIGASLTRSITATASGIQGANFSDVYGNGYEPDVTFFYEYQPWHSEWYGNLGFMASLGIGYYGGAGVFAVALKNPNGVPFGSTSHVQTQFFDVPTIVGLDYRFNLFKYFSPFVSAGPAAIGFYETRNDGGPSHTALSYGVYTGAGVSILMDWMSKVASWDLYSEHGIQHYYLTVEYDNISTFAGAVSFQVSGAFAGFTFEF